MISVIKIMRRKKDKYIASLMDELEQVLDPESKEFETTRKIILDHFNDFYRQVYRIMLGIDVEGQSYK